MSNSGGNTRAGVGYPANLGSLDKRADGCR